MNHTTTPADSLPRFSATETLNRIRRACKQAEALDPELTASCRKEVGHRTVHQISSTLEGATVSLDGDDLADQDDLRTASRTPLCRLHGSVLHIYYSSPGEYGELLTTITIWIGTATEEPQLLRLPGRRVAVEGRTGVEPGTPLSYSARGYIELADSTEPTELPAEEIARRAAAAAAYRIEQLAEAEQRAEWAEAKAARYAAGDFQPGDFVKATMGYRQVEGYVTDGLCRLGSTTPHEYRVKLNGYPQPVERFSIAELIEANAERAASSARYARSQAERLA